MSDVNPELTDESIRKLRDRVHALFGSRSDALVKSVARFLKSDPGSLDHQNLRIIATAAPHVGDPALVAKLIDELPITQMHVAATPIDIESGRAGFGRILPEYSNRTRQRLVADLVIQNAVETISFCPSEAVSDAGKKVIEDHLLSLARGTRDQQQAAIGSPFATPEVIDAVLDEIQRRIERSERGTADRASGPLPFDLVSRGLLGVVDRGSAAATAAQVTRAWHLSGRCQAEGVQRSTFLLFICQSSKLEENTAHSVLDAVDRLQSDENYNDSFIGDLRNRMIGVPEMPASVVRRVLSSRPAELTDNEHGVYWGPSLSPVIVDTRWSLFRNAVHANDLDDATENPTSEEIDRWISQASVGLIESYGRDLVVSMTDPDSLAELGKRLFDKWLFENVCENPNTPKKMFTDLLMAMNLTPLSDDKKIFGRTGNEHRVLADRRLGDDDIADFLERENPTDYSGNEFRKLLETAVMNPSAGRRVLHYVTENRPDPHVLYRFAMTSPNPEVHRLLADLIDEATHPDDGRTRRVDASHAEAIRNGLALNGTVSSEIASTLPRTIYPAISSGNVASDYRPSRYTYGPSDVAARLIREGRSDAPHIGLMIEEWGDLSEHRLETTEALRSMADAGLLNAEHWRELTCVADRHDATLFAIHPECNSNSSALTMPAVSRLDSTIDAVEAGVPLPEREPRSWDDLPDEKDKPLTPSPAALLIDNQVVEGLALEVPKTVRQLDDLAREMGNCLTYFQDRIASGAEVVAAARDDAVHEIYAVAWRIDSDTSGRHATITQINSKRNQNRVPHAFQAKVHLLTDKMNRGVLQPVTNEALVVEQSSVEQDPATELQPVRRRPTIRRQVLELVADPPLQLGAPQQLREEEAPFLLVVEADAVGAVPESERGRDEEIDPAAPDPLEGPADRQAPIPGLNL